MDDLKVPQEVGKNAESASLSENDLDQVAGGKPAAQPTPAPQKQHYMTVELTDVMISGYQ